jgi:cytochrome c peroxidase
MSHPQADFIGTRRKTRAAVCGAAFLFLWSTPWTSHCALAAAVSIGLPAVATPDGAARSASAVVIGKRLFFDKRLSADGTISCSVCHDPKKAYSDGLPVAKGIQGQLGTRKAPSLLNVAFTTSEFWDGRRESLEQQAIDPLLNPREHGLRDGEAVLHIIRSDRTYNEAFQRSFGVSPDHITIDLVAMAIASFERTLIAGNSPFDRYLYADEKAALSPNAAQGLELFRGRARCASCHLIGEHYALLTDNHYHRVGIGASAIEGARLSAATNRVINATPAELDHLISEDPDIAALGRFVVTKNPRDIGLFKTPTLRNVALTAPYMHDGSVKTLAAALDAEIYYRSVEAGRPLILTPNEKADLQAFLISLTSPVTRQ